MSDFGRIFRTGLLPALFVCVLCSAIALPILQQQKRARLNELYQQTVIRDKAQAEWRRLLLEQATLNAPGRIEKLAQLKLQMRMPKHEQMRELVP